MTGVGWTKGWADIAGGRLAYHRTGGDGPPVVLAHGLTDNGLCWTRLARALEDRFDLVLLDARGHGESSRVAPDASFDPGEDLAQACDALGLESPIVIGHSVGGRAALDFAGAHPRRVSRLILEDPPLLPQLNAEAAEQRRLKFMRDVEALQALSDGAIADHWRAIHPGWAHEEFPAWRDGKRQVDPSAMPRFATPWREALKRITAPTLLLYGDAGLVTEDIAAEAHRLNGAVVTVRIPAAGHNIRREKFPDYLSAMSRFLLAPEALA